MNMLHNLKRKANLTSPTFVLLFWVLTLASGNFISMSVQTSSTLINLPSTYTFTINRQFDPINLKFNTSILPVPLSTTIVITLPSQFITISTGPTLSCINAANSQALTCNVNIAAKTITVTDYYSTNATLSNGVLVINVFNLINAFKAGPSDNFLWQIIGPTGTVIDTGPSTGSGTSITFTPKNFQDCAVSAGGATVSSYSPITLSITPADPIPVSGQLVVVIPLDWSSDPMSTATINASPSCTGILNTGGSVSCTYFSSPTSQIITISSLSTTSLSSLFSVNIANVLIPPTVGSSQTIYIYSQWSDGTQINTCTSRISNIASVPFQLARLTSNDNTTVQSTFTASLKLTISRDFYYQDSIVLLLPDQFLNCQISSTTFSSFTRSQNLNTVTLTNFPSVPQSITSNNILAFTISSITNPPTTANISLTASIFRNNQLYQQSVLNYSATVGSIDSFVILPTSSFVQNTGRATFTIASSLFFPSGSTINIVYPISITASIVPSSSVTLATLNGSIVSNATYQVTSNQIRISNLFTTKFSGTVVVIIDLFTNPPNVQSTTYLIQVFDQIGSSVMSGSTTLTATTRAFLNASITASSYQVLQSSVTYTAAITTNFGFTSIAIIVPNDITIGSGFSVTCAPSSFSSCALNGNNLTFTAPSTLPAGSYQLQWGYVTNPNSFAPTSSFQIFSYSNGFGVQNSQGGLSIAMNTPSPFTSFILTPSSYINSATISITLILTLPSNTPAGNLRIAVPTQVVITSATCTGCTVSSPNIFISLPAGTPNLTVVINNVRNVGSFKPVASFLVTLTSNTGFASLSSSVAAWTNNQASSFSTVVTGTNNYMGQSNNLKMSLSSLSGNQSYVVIMISSSFGAFTTAPSGFTLISSNSLQTGCSGSSCNFNFSAINPTINTSYTFSLQTYTSDNFLVGTSTSNNWFFECFNTNCRSCNPNGTCITCYSSPISEFFILNTFSQTCERDCASGYFRVNNTCTICDSNCSQCVNTSTTCTRCANTYFLQTKYSICVPKCLNGYFANTLSQTCTACTEPCLTCIDTSTKCVSCINNYYLFNNSCLSICPLNFFIANVVTRICDPCSANCLTCSGTTTFCLTCNTSIDLYFQNNICVTNCSSNYFLVNNVCTYCQAPCRICSGSTTVCSTCFLNSSLPVFFNQTCIAASQCPVGHYVNSTNSSCEVCPSSCIQCSSATVCSVCSLNFYLFGTLCISSCPNTTYFANTSSTGICQPCNGCATCSSSITCTSCIASQFLYNSVCYSVCPNGSFPTGSICSACPSNCPTCTNLTFCTSCVTSMNLYQGLCYLVCPNGTFANTTQQLCVTCPVRCATCTSLSSCQTCVAGYSLQNSQCVLICSQGLSFNQICYPCGLNCDICVNATCSKCASNYYLYNNTCLTQCPTNMLSLDSIACVSCTEKFVNCSTCSFNACLTCTYGQLLNGNCVPCSPGFYAQSGACTTCPSTCATCDSQTYCLTCKTGNYMLQNQCFSSCPLNMIPNGTVCASCLANCNICNQVNFLCTVCSAGYYLYNNLCFSTCPDGLVVSYDFLTCTTKQKYYQQFSKAAKIVPFPFTIATGVLVIIGAILRFFHKDMHLQTVLCAIISIIQIATWCIFLGFQYIYFSNFHQLALYNIILAVVGVGFLLILDFVHLRFYCKYIRDDMEFVKWVKKNCCANGSMLAVATIFNFKFYRFVHSKFLGREQTSMVLSSVNKLTPFSMISVISIFICSIPVFVGCGLALYNSISQDQQFFIALDTITVTGIMILLLIMDLRHPDDYFVDEHEAKNLKKKVYQQDEVNFQEQFGNPMEDNVSHQQLMQINDDQAQIQEDQGDMALPPSANKLQSTFQKTNKKAIPEVTHLAAESKIEPHSQNYYEIGSQENIVEESQLSEEPPRQVKSKWQEKLYDHHGYLIKYDANNNPLKYDENGYRVEIGEDGKHRKYNQDGLEMIMVDGKFIPHDKDGFRIINGKRYDNRGYEIRQQNGQLVAYDQHGFKVIGQPPNQKHIDENGHEVIIDENGELRRYQEDGWEVVQLNGEKLFKNKQGQYVRKNQQGQWETYDPTDGFTLKLNAQTGQLEKYNDLGLKVVKDKYGNLHYYDEDGFKVTILPGGELIRHDERGYRVERDENGKLHRFDQQGYELMQDSNGRPYFVDKHGYRVERDLYGRTNLYDEEGNQVRIDPETGKHRKYNQQGLQIVTDLKGNKTLVDKRGHIVKELQGTYQKYDQQGNKIWLDEDGYEVEQDSQGKVNRYDKVGDRVDTEYQIQESEGQGNLMINTNKKLPQRYRYKPTVQMDQQAELQKLISAPQLVEFQDDEEISELQEFHNVDFPPQRDVTHQFESLVEKQRSELVFRDDFERGLEDLKEFEHKEELYGYLPQPNTDIDGPNGFGSLPYNTNRQLQDHNIDRHAEFDQQFALRGLDGRVPHLVVLPLQGNRGLTEREVKQGELDQKFTVIPLDARQPVLSNKALTGHRQLGDRELGRQGEYDQQAYVRQIDDNQPDILEIRRRDAERAELARKRAEDRNLSASRAQQEIQIKSVADVSIGQRSFDNQGVQPLENRTDFDQINSLDELQVPLGRRGRGNRSDVSLINGKKDTQTVYNYNTVQVQIKNQNQLYDEDEEIESLHEQDWQEQLNPMVFSRRVKEHPNNSNANTNTNILYLDDPDHEDAPNDALTDLLQHSQSKHKTHRYRPSDMLSRQAESIDQIEEQLFRQARPQRERQREMREREIKQRRQFRLSGAPNPLVEYAKTIQANKKSLQEKMYLQQTYKR